MLREDRHQCPNKTSEVCLSVRTQVKSKRDMYVITMCDDEFEVRVLKQNHL